MQIINRMADRMLDALAPKITAEAGLVCTPQQFLKDCACRSGLQIARLCTVRSNCTETCGACDITITNLHC